MEHKEYMSANELAQHLGVCRRTVYNRMKEPGFPVVRFGGLRLIDVAEFRKWIKARSGTKEGMVK